MPLVDVVGALGRKEFEPCELAVPEEQETLIVQAHLLSRHRIGFGIRGVDNADRFACRQLHRLDLANPDGAPPGFEVLRFMALDTGNGRRGLGIGDSDGDAVILVGEAGTIGKIAAGPSFRHLHMDA